MNAPEAPFDEPWQAQLFALTVALNEAGHFTWKDWSSVFGPEVQDADAGTYWHIWSAALVILLDKRGLAAAADIEALTEAWQEAAAATPHGTPSALPAASE